MRAAVLNSPQDLVLTELPTPSAAAGEVVVKVGATTLCGSDIRIFLGQKTGGVRWPAVIGHEFAGTVAEVGQGVEGLTTGQTVAVIPWIPCGRCVPCQAGQRNLCDNLVVLGYGEYGSLAEYVRIPAQAVAAGNVVPVDPEVPAAHLALAEPLACCVHGHRRTDIRLGHSVLIIGGGPIGLFHLQLAVLAGASKVIVSEPSQLRRDYAIRFGAGRVVDPTAESLVDVVAAETGGIGVDRAILCIGYDQLVGDLIACTRKGGRINLFAGFGGDGTGSINFNTVHYNELDVVGNVGGTRADYQDALSLLISGKIDAAAMITAQYDLSDADKAVAAAMGGDALKVVITHDPAA